MQHSGNSVQTTHATVASSFNAAFCFIEDWFQGRTIPCALKNWKAEINAVLQRLTDDSNSLEQKKAAFRELYGEGVMTDGVIGRLVHFEPLFAVDTLKPCLGDFVNNLFDEVSGLVPYYS
jgi:hypothetical protein